MLQPPAQPFPDCRFPDAPPLPDLQDLMSQPTIIPCPGDSS
ncbi:hypothetical protein [Xylella fastidiosa]|nr:hypothetical protein [Xylella fastidiosa]